MHNITRVALNTRLIKVCVCMNAYVAVFRVLYAYDYIFVLWSIGTFICSLRSPISLLDAFSPVFLPGVYLVSYSTLLYILYTTVVLLLILYKNGWASVFWLLLSKEHHLFNAFAWVSTYKVSRVYCSVQFPISWISIRWILSGIYIYIYVCNQNYYNSINVPSIQ